MPVHNFFSLLVYNLLKLFSVWISYCFCKTANIFLNLINRENLKRTLLYKSTLF